MRTKCHIVHIVYKLSTGGLENGLINLINHLPFEQVRHTIISLTDADQFQSRIKAPDVVVHCLGKQPGPLSAYGFKIVKLIKQLKPDILHTRNLATLECQWMGWAAGVPFRIHSEHGRDSDIQGTHKKSIRIRKWMKPFVHEYIALSKDLQSYLLHQIGVPSQHCHQIYNGVDTLKFKPADIAFEHNHLEHQTLLTVGRLDKVKNIDMLLSVMPQLIQRYPDLRVQIAGDGPERKRLQDLASALNVMRHVSFLGAREDLPALMQKASLYVQCSKFEGISNTILEAMSSGLCVIASKVGGNPELIDHGENGFLFERPEQMIEHITACLSQPQLCYEMGLKARDKICQRFSLAQMCQEYWTLYKSRSEALCVA